MKNFFIIAIVAIMMTACGENYTKEQFTEENTITLLTSENGLKGLSAGPAAKKSGKKILPVAYEEITLLAENSIYSNYFSAKKGGNKTLYWYDAFNNDLTEVITVPEDKMTILKDRGAGNDLITIAEKDGKFLVFRDYYQVSAPFDKLFWHKDHADIVVERDGVSGILSFSEEKNYLKMDYELVYLVLEDGSKSILVRKKGEDKFANLSSAYADGFGVIGFVPAQDMKKILSASKLTNGHLLIVPNDMVTKATYRYSRSVSVAQAREDAKYLK